MYLHKDGICTKVCIHLVAFLPCSLLIYDKHRRGEKQDVNLKAFVVVVLSFGIFGILASFVAQNGLCVWVHKDTNDTIKYLNVDCCWSIFFYIFIGFVVVVQNSLSIYICILWYIVFKVNLLTISKEYCVCLFSSLNYNENPFISSLFHPFAAKVLFLHIHIYLYEIIFLILMGFCWTNGIVRFHPMSRDLYTLFKKNRKNISKAL